VEAREREAQVEVHRRPTSRGYARSRSNFTTAAIWQHRRLFSFLLLLSAMAVGGASPAAAQTSISGTISADSTWTAIDSPYLLSGNVVVNAGSTLTLAPGTVVKGVSSSSRLDVRGRIVSQGTAESPVVFTSFRDDSVGGDSNGDGDGSAPGAGNWSGIFLRGTQAENLIDHTVLRYAGSSTNSNRGALYISGSTGVVSNSVVENSSQAIFVEAASPRIESNLIRSNSRGVVVTGTSTPTVTGNTLIGNGLADLPDFFGPPIS
jgi:parallel beta-helix repeat protein